MKPLMLNMAAPIVPYLIAQEVGWNKSFKSSFRLDVRIIDVESLASITLELKT